MMRKKHSLVAGLAICTLTVLLTAMYVIFTGMFTVKAEYIPPCDIADSYAKDAILQITETAVMQTETAGGKTYFHPQREVTRKEFAKMLTVLLDLPYAKYESIEIGFADEKSISPSDLSYIRTVLANGYMRLYPDYTFRTDAKVTREEAADILANLCIGAISTGASEKYTDLEKTNAAFLKSAKKLLDYEIMIGYPDNTFKPTNAITREELALTVYRLIQNEYYIKRIT